MARAAESIRIDAAAKPQFMQQAAVAQRQLDAAESMTAFRGDAE